MGAIYKSGLRVSEYILEEMLGAGAFAEVWRARHHMWGDTRVAVKLPSQPEYARHLQREGLVVHGLRHPNIVRVLGLDPYAEPPYLVMELVNGPSLKQVVADHPGGIEPAAAITITRGILNALDASHRTGILHRDLKPGNVLLNLDKRPAAQVKMEDVKVGDFGLGGGTVDLLNSIMQSASLNRDDRLVGTLAYMAPELRDGRGEPDPRSDLYAVGVMLFELLTGERPAGAELPSTMRDDLPEPLDHIYRKLYARHDRRYESAAAVQSDILAMLRAGEQRPVMPAIAGASRCPECSRGVGPQDQFCIHCGTQVATTVRRCAGCGGYPSLTDSYCIFCGQKL